MATYKSIVRLQFGVTKFEEIILTDEEVCDDDVDERKEDLHRETFPGKQESKIISKIVQKVFNDLTQQAVLPGVIGHSRFAQLVDQRKVLSKAKMAQVHQDLQFCRSRDKDQVFHRITTPLQSFEKFT